ncbi:hypothetical protein [Legionella sainthelensi]|uniref:hypothetical protein n=1 Tax=Legionella sainthelensi TaxID=28087 RepID=UPI000E204E58|nr:hypothetical protein [Legionella sainthelensi]
MSSLLLHYIIILIYLCFGCKKVSEERIITVGMNTNPYVSFYPQYQDKFLESPSHLTYVYLRNLKLHFNSTYLN